MPIHCLTGAATPEEMDEMLEALRIVVKFAVDIRLSVAAGGGRLHADCEQVLLGHGSRQEDIWGADFFPAANQVRFEAMINLVPSRGNDSMQILDGGIRRRVERIVRTIVGRATDEHG